MELKDIKMSSRQMLLDISSMFTYAQKLLKAKKEYSLLLQTLININYYNDSDVPLPLIKDLSQATGISYAKIRNQLRHIYEDLIFGTGIEDPNECMFSFKNVIYVFIVYSFDKEKVFSFEVSSLPVMPRVGEEIILPYFKAYLGTDRFYVEDISHSFFDQDQSIQFILKYGEYNSYWHYRKSKAIAEGELNFHDLYECNDWELKKKLKVGRY